MLGMHVISFAAEAEFLVDDELVVRVYRVIQLRRGQSADVEIDQDWREGELTQWSACVHEASKTAPVRMGSVSMGNPSIGCCL